MGIGITILLILHAVQIVDDVHSRRSIILVIDPTTLGNVHVHAISFWEMNLRSHGTKLSIAWLHTSFLPCVYTHQSLYCRHLGFGLSLDRVWIPH